MAETDQEVIDFFNHKQMDKTKYETLEFYHSAIGSLRFVKAFSDKMFLIESTATRDAGTYVTFTRANFEAEKPAQTNTPDARITVNLGRVGSGVKGYLSGLYGYDFIEPIQMIYRLYIGDGEAKRIFALTCVDVSFNNDSCSITASDENPTNRDIARLYTVEDFPGLETI